MPQTRRQFVTRAGAGAAAILVPPALLQGVAAARPLRGGRFADGVMSGDPATRAISLWTRVDTEQAGTVELEVATDKGFRKVVARKAISAKPSANGAVKARVTGLKPREEYYYRFSTRTTDSEVGRFRTAPPADSKETVKFAFFSCQDYTHGYYNAHEVMADGDYDFVVCLGDYIYAESYHSVNGTKTAVRDDRIGRENPDNKSIVREAVTLGDYRRKYSLYRSDKALREVHRRFPMIVIWDDHEVQDNYAGGEKDGGLPPSKHFSSARRKAAERAFYENMPSFGGSTRLYRKLQYGSLLVLVVMDQRRYRADQPCGDAVAPPCEGYDAPRDFLGRRQMGYVKDALASSKAAWKVLCNEVTMMPTRVLGGSNYTYDTWLGYPRERAELLQHIKDKSIKDVVFVTGDIHTFIAGDVRDGDGSNGQTLATEFVGGSITSQSLGETDIDAGGGVVIKGNDANPKTDPGLINALRGFNPHVDNADFDHHGFGEATLTANAFTCQMVRMDTIKKRSRKKLSGAEWKYVVQRGNPSIKGQHGPAT
ncbi:MAG: alkaline phosphatase D family protein [Solirubrobacterales bacterium]|nr:alkaline phosphatase D family protein [Solirubrobacterales bacterium]